LGEMGQISLYFLTDSGVDAFLKKGWLAQKIGAGSRAYPNLKNRG
jgi:hypothetical protein